jgi:hypothetical protein
VAAGEQPVGEQDAEERDEERAEQEEERLVVAEVDEERSACRDGRRGPDERPLRDLGKQVLQRDGAGVDVGKRLVALVDREREQGEQARQPARGDGRQERRSVADLP